MDDPHPLLALFLHAAESRFPPADGRVTVLPPLSPGLECSVAFTAHAVVATALPAPEVLAQGPDGYGGSMAPDFLRYLAGREGTVGTTDVVLVARGISAPPCLFERSDVDNHPRVRHARELRENVRVFGDARGFVTLADGLAGRREISIELEHPDDAGTGHGRALLRDALTSVPAGEPVFAAVAPGNARSLRAFLAAGFAPLGSEVILRPQRLRLGAENGPAANAAASLGSV
ncbi:hypothetical protein [Streptomyces aureocirculatus]|uniref:hypothetical protein n=1 Tax=Streptomyces aureocirculatus TaxID=67275 RepID=UPI00068A7DCC|nr:hypothetical protein [Streptomyces aureocirculatus]